MKTRTYREWQKEGFQVRKGEKSIGRNSDGVAVFSEAQVDWADYGDEDYDHPGESVARLEAWGL